MLTFNAIAPKLALPTRTAVWLLEGGIALVVSAYVAYQWHQPLVVSTIVVPLLWVLLAALVFLIAGLIPPAIRTALDVVVLTILISTLAVPTLRDLVASPQVQGSSAVASSNPQRTGPLNAAPEPLKLERIELGAEVLNGGTQPLEVQVSFVRLNERGRAYCAGKPLSPSSSGRSRLGAGESMIFMSGNCQGGFVALTVWDTTGRRIYQTSAFAE